MRFFLQTILLPVAFVASFFSAAAQAADCKPLHILNTVKMESIANGNRILIPVAINGVKKKLILDTGGITTELDHEAAQALGLREEDGGMPLFDAYGNMSRLSTTVKTFELVQLTAKNFTLRIFPFSGSRKADVAESPSPDIAGILSMDLFLLYDIDLDFGSLRLNYFSQDHCEGRVAYWPERPVAIVPFEMDSHHIAIPVTVDGHSFKAILDTGATNSIMSDATARTIGIAPGSADTPIAQISDSDPLLKYYSHKFANLSFEGLAVSNPKISIMTDRVGSGDPAFKSSIRGALNDPFNHVKLPELIIGMNVLKHLHLYIAFKEKKLYISPAGTGESVLFKTPAAPAN